MRSCETPHRNTHGAAAVSHVEFRRRMRPHMRPQPRVRQTLIRRAEPFRL